jgi:hypothetical protein
MGTAENHGRGSFSTQPTFVGKQFRLSNAGRFCVLSFENHRRIESGLAEL